MRLAGKAECSILLLLVTIGTSIFIALRLYSSNMIYSIAGEPVFSEEISVPFKDEMSIERFYFAASLAENDLYVIELANPDLEIGVVKVLGPDNYSRVLNSSLCLETEASGTYTFHVEGVYLLTNTLRSLPGGTGLGGVVKRGWDSSGPIGSEQPPVPDNQVVIAQVFGLVGTSDPLKPVDFLIFAGLGLSAVVVAIVLFSAVIGHPLLRAAEKTKGNAQDKLSHFR